jgi:hypothetical protein
MSDDKGSALVKREPELQMREARIVPLDEGNVFQLGEMIAQSGYFQDAKQAAQAVVKVLAGRELGLGAIASMTGIYIVQGRVTLSANLIAAVIKRSGKYNYRVREMSEKACEIEFFEGGESLGKSKFTIEEARVAKLADGDNWKKYPRNMLFARAMSNGAKWYAADVFAGPVYTPDELGAHVSLDESGEMRVEETQAKATAQETRTAEDERGALVAQVREMCAELNSAGYKPVWTAVTLNTYVNEKFMRAGGLESCSLDDLRALRTDLFEKLKATPVAAGKGASK